jgi:hypothetical protein
MSFPLQPANRTTPLPPYIAVRATGSARNSLRGSTVTDQMVSGVARRPPGSTTVTIARSQRTLANAEVSQASENLKLSTRA